MLEKIIDDLIEKFGEISAILVYDRKINCGNGLGILHGAIWIHFKSGRDCLVDKNGKINESMDKSVAKYRLNMMLEYCKIKYGFVDAPVNVMIDRIIEDLCEKELV